ncbi:small ribosomal subunit protein mS23-like [Littorina saxatilis]|uniref:Small ribosomal subunit protein mS23 n=1 Tax=Littorina saxatilis TaxID=31220 RepID=A0AAN9AKK6_9CAEN
MAGSRLEKFGTIYKRVQGLLRSGALKEADKPLWCEVYEAFPPRDPPIYEREKPTGVVPKILYPEDIIRAQFYKTYGNPDVVDFRNERVKTTCQRFVDKYLELLQSEMSKENLFESTVTALKEEGFRLRAAEEVEEFVKTAEAKSPGPPPRLQQQTLSVASIFGEDTVRGKNTEEEDFIMESDDGKTTKL